VSSYRILVTGSREWTGAFRICTVLAEYYKQDATAVLVSGACPKGADHLAEYWWKRWSGTIERHPADWDQFGKAAGFRRNAEMVALGADICLAFALPCTRPDCTRLEPHDTHGTEDCMKRARAAGIPVERLIA
jgi:YspA, cpYpsA-related SLOG family